MEHANPERDLTPVAEALFRGQKIEAIKRYRESHGGGLKEAKDAVEALEAGLREKTPEKFSAAGGGCLTCLAFVLSSLTIGCGMLAVVYRG